MIEKPSDAEILSNIIKELDTNAHKLATRLGYNSPSSVYHVVNGLNSISTEMANKIIEIYPQINFAYLMKGELPIALSASEMQGQSNLRDSNQRMSFDDIPRTLKNIEIILQKILDKLDKE